MYIINIFFSITIFETMSNQSDSTTSSQTPPEEVTIGSKTYKRRAGQVNPLKVNEDFPTASDKPVFWAKGYCYQVVAAPGRESRARSRSASRTAPSTHQPDEFLLYEGRVYMICPLSQRIPDSLTKVVKEKASVTASEERGRPKKRDP